MAITLAKQLGTLRDLDAGQYLVDPATATRVREVHVCCPLCGDASLLDEETHFVAPDGRVTPAFVCRECPFLDWLVCQGVNE